MIDIDELHRKLLAQLEEEILGKFSFKFIAERGISMSLNGNSCITAIEIWPNGCCDVDYLYMHQEQGQFKHYQFTSIDEAFERIQNEMHLAIERANE